MGKNKSVIAVTYALLAAVFYAINTPFSKVLLNVVPPTFMASFLYLGAGLGVGIMYLFHFKKEEKTERLNRLDMPYTIGMIVRYPCPHISDAWNKHWIRFQCFLTW